MDTTNKPGDMEQTTEQHTPETNREKEQARWVGRYLKSIAIEGETATLSNILTKEIEPLLSEVQQLRERAMKR